MKKNNYIYSLSENGEGYSTDNSCDKGSSKASERLVRPSINNTNKRKHINRKTKEKENSQNEFPPTQKQKNVKEQFTAPDIEEIQSYFLEKENTVIEAEKFYNYFESNGWLVGGKTKMKNWKAAARNWMMRSKEFQKEKQPDNPLSTNQNKDYSIPL